MIHAIPFPAIEPEIFTIELGAFSFALRWYALAYIVGILIGWRLILAAVSRQSPWAPGQPRPTREAVDELLTAVILGVILGGRLGFVLFYQPGYYLANPAEILMVWQGGMSFHGGLLGVTVAALIFARRQALPFLGVTDLLALATPPGLLLGRAANFINAELWGRPTEAPWGVIFPGAAAQDCPGVTGPCARHPSQLYEAGLEGLLLGALVLLAVFAWGWLRRPGQVTGLFLAGYGISRFVVEFFRQADAQFITADNPAGHVLQLGGAGLSMGQLLSLPMILLGLALMLWARRRGAAAA